MTSPRILFLDDSPERRKAAGRALSCITVATLEEFETALDSGPWTSIYVASEEAAALLVKRGERAPLVCVHADVGPAAVRMVAALSRGGCSVVRKSFDVLAEEWKARA